MIDKIFCMSSYMAFRYIERDNIDFYDGIHHENIKPIPQDKRILVHTVDDIDRAIKQNFDKLKGKKLGIMLSGGMDSACLASYMPGCDAYTFRFLGGEFQKDELSRAEYYAKYYDLKLHYVDIDWESINRPLEKIMRAKAAPVHSIEPQIYLAAEQAKADGIECMIMGNSADPIFGGMDGLLSRDRTVEEFANRYTYVQPHEVLREPVDMRYVYDRYDNNGMIDISRFMDEVYSIESSSSYDNAFRTAGLSYLDGYMNIALAEPLDIARIRGGEPKYLIRALFAKKYPIPVPDKNPMPRPVDSYFASWEGPHRSEFRDDIDMSKYTGNQKWQMYCLEKFLDMFEK